ncbi:MAG TPA: hypothetical protein VIJ00_02100 [Nakamurella sp.]
MSGDWWYDNIIEPGKLPMLICLGAFVLTFVLTRVITRMIRAGIGPFRNNVSSGGLHIHHAVPGIILLVIGALTAIRGPESPWIEIAGALVGIGTSLILDEFALILHLEDVYWSNEGRISVELAGLTAACIGFVMLGSSPLGVDDLSMDDVTLRIGVITGIAFQGILVVICLLKAKYRAALISCFIPVVSWFCAFRLARPNSWWARHFYGDKRQLKAIKRGEKFDRRWDPKARWLSDLIAGAPSEPDPPDILAADAARAARIAEQDAALEGGAPDQPVTGWAVRTAAAQPAATGQPASAQPPPVQDAALPPAR